MTVITSSRWEEIGTLPEGDLREVPYPVLLLAYSRARRTATVELSRRPVEKRIVFEAGELVDCRSNLVHETFGRFLVGAGKVAEADLGGALAESASRDLPLGEVLMGRGVLDAGELYKLLQQSLARKLLDGFTWRQGRFRPLRDGEPPRSALKVRVPQLVLTGVLKLTPLDEVTRGLQPLLAEPLAINRWPWIPPEDVQLRGAAEEVLAAFAGRGLRMDELAAKLPGMAANDLGRVVYALSLLEMVVPASRAGRAPSGAVPVAPATAASSPDARAAGSRGAAGAAVEAGAPADFEATRNRVLEAFLAYRRKDALDLLGLSESATTTDVEEAWLRFARDTAPWALESSGSPDLVEKARALFLAGSDAYAELRDGERRNVLLQRRRAERMRRGQEPRGDRIQTDLLDPEAQFRKGKELLAAGQERKALELLQYAADLDAQNALYRAEAAWCRYRVTSSAERPLEALDEAVRADPRCGLAWYYLGVIQGDGGRRAEAEESLRRAIKLMSPDRRPIEALKELTARKR
jgi:tetratricopeptide (TPR) repeat protein